MYSDNLTILALFVGNLYSSPFQKILLEVVPPVSINVGYDGEPNLTLDGNAVCVPFLSPGGSAVLLVSLAAGTPASFIDSGLVVKLTYANPVNGQSTVLNVTVPLSYSDLLRPMTITTPDFGNKWKMFTAEARHSMRSSCTSSAEVMSRLQTLRVHPVQTIGLENIAACHLIHGPGGTMSPILIHVKVGSGTLEILVRTANKQLSANMLKVLAFFLQ
jgi:hypothetical protein